MPSPDTTDDPGDNATQPTGQPPTLLEQRITDLEAALRHVTEAAQRDRRAVLAEIAELQVTLEELVPGAAGPAAQLADQLPAGWATTATVEDWQILIAWVDWIGRTYDVTPARFVPPCWPAHPGAVEELAALRDAWQASRALPAGEAMIQWHDRWLAPCLHRLQSGYQLGQCHDQHQPPRSGRGAATEHLPYNASDDCTGG